MQQLAIDCIIMEGKSMSAERDSRTNQEGRPNQAPPAQHRPEQHRPDQQPGTGQHGQPGQQKSQPGGYPQPRRDERRPDQRQDDPQKDDGDLVGQDTDGDGKVVKPGQPPGQSHGKGLKDE